jgi:hypothetical protein
VSRTLGTTLGQAVLSQQTAEVAITLVTLTHVGGPTYLCDNNEDVVSNGVTFSASRIQVRLINNSSGLSRARLVVDNVGRDFIDEIRLATTPIVAKLELIVLSEPDDIVITQPDLVLRNLVYDELMISGELQQELLMHQGYPQYTMTPALFPGLF